MSAESEDRLAGIIAEYLQAREAGETPGRDQLLSRHPDLARELSAFIDGEEQFEQVVAPLRLVSPMSATSDGKNSGRDCCDDETVDEELAEFPCDFADYELVEEIARGGMGIVYRARHKVLNRFVALKTIRDGRFACQSDVHRFQMEAMSAASLEHPSIVPIYESGQHQGHFFYCMQLVEGRSLDHDKDRFVGNAKEIAKLLEAAARAVHFAHVRGVLHCDLKPANILIDQGGRPYITDFGLARRLEQGTAIDWSASMKIAGTLNYMAPEQVAGNKQLTTAVDVHALGAILYELLAGVPPFKGESPMEVLFNIRELEARPPSALQTNVNLELESICLKCLAKQPNERYRSAEELADDLKRWDAGEPILARPVRLHRQVMKWIRRKPQIAALIFAVVLALVATGAALAIRVGYMELDQAYDQVLNLRTISENQRQKAESSFAVAQRFLYYYQINDAQSHVRVHDTKAADDILNDTPTDLRSWEWHYLKQLAVVASQLPRNPDVFDSANTILGKHSRAVYGLAWSTDGSHLASASSDKSIRIWDAAGRGQPLELVGHDGYVESVAYSQCGRLLASASFDQTIRLWDATTGHALHTLRGHEGSVNAVAFHPTQDLLASGGQDGTVRIWDSMGASKGIVGAPGVPVIDVAFDPKGGTLAAAYGDGLIRIWDVATRVPKLTIQASRVTHNIAFSPAGDRLVSGGRVDGQIALWEVPTGAAVLGIQVGIGKNAFGDLLFTHDGRRIVSVGRNGSVDFWDATSGRKVFSLPWSATVVALDPDGLRLAWASGNGTVGFWEGQ